MDPLQSSEAVQQFMKLLEENGRTGQAADLSALMWYMDGMSRQFDAVYKELQEVKAQLAQEKEPAVKKVMESAVANLENKAEQARNIFRVTPPVFMSLAAKMKNAMASSV